MLNKHDLAQPTIAYGGEMFSRYNGQKGETSVGEMKLHRSLVPQHLVKSEYTHPFPSKMCSGFQNLIDKLDMIVSRLGYEETDILPFRDRGKFWKTENFAKNESIHCEEKSWFITKDNLFIETNLETPKFIKITFLMQNEATDTEKKKPVWTKDKIHDQLTLR